MATRREQVQAHRFLIRRQTSALLHGDPDSLEAPLRKLNVGMVSSVVIGALFAAGFGIYGLLDPGGATSWRSGQALILEKGSTARFVYSGGELHPVLNYASARLLLGGTSFSVDTVSGSSLQGVPRGLPVGIPGAPEELPSPSSLLTVPWTTCSVPAQDAAGGVAPYVRLTVGQPPPGSALPPGSSLLVTAPDGTAYLIWNDQRLRIDGTFVLSALGYAAVSPLPVGTAWLDTVPQGQDLAPPPVPDEGGPAPAVGGRPTLVGQMFTVTNAGTAPQMYLAYADGLAPITLTQANLHLDDPATQAAYPGGRSVAAIPLTAGQLSEAPRSARHPALGSGLPGTPPPVADTTGSTVSVCSDFTDTSGMSLNVDIRIVALTPDQIATTPAGTSPVDAQGDPLADQVVLPPGDGAVVRSLPAPGVTEGTAYLVTDLGVKYPVPDTSTLASLGLSGVSPVPLPTALLQLLRTGPQLDQRDAARIIAILPDENGAPQPQIPIPAASG